MYLDEDLYFLEGWTYSFLDILSISRVQILSLEGSKERIRVRISHLNHLLAISDYHFTKMPSNFFTRPNTATIHLAKQLYLQHWENSDIFLNKKSINKFNILIHQLTKITKGREWTWQSLQQRWILAKDKVMVAEFNELTRWKKTHHVLSFYKQPSMCTNSHLTRWVLTNIKNSFSGRQKCWCTKWNVWILSANLTPQYLWPK